MSDSVYNTMILRRRFCKRIILALVSFGFSFYASVLLFGDLKSPRIINLSGLDRCPACYGVSVCPELYSNQITLDSNLGWTNVLNAKNIYHGYTKSNRRVILKLLAHDWELRELDNTLCKTWGLQSNCKPMQLIHSPNIKKQVTKLLEYNLSSPDLAPRKGLVLCPYSLGYYDLLKPVIDKNTNFRYDMIYIWTMLKINPEPIVMQLIPKSKGWPVPAYGGVCGRLELVAYEGEPLSSLMHLEWHRKLKFAHHILNAAMDFTFKHERYRFYLMDWSLDNLVANEEDYVTFVDLEDVIIVDKHIAPKSDLPEWYKIYSRENQMDFSFSIDKICRHHLSDHNIWAACYVLAGPENPLLYPLPKHVNDTRPHFDALLKNCLNGDNKFQSLTRLQNVINDMLLDEKIVGYGAVTR